MEKEKEIKTARPETEEERRRLKEMAASDFSIFIPTGEKIVSVWSFISIKYLSLNALVYVLIFILANKSWHLAGIFYIFLSFPSLIFTIWKLNKIHSGLYELRFILPEKTSYTQTILDENLTHSYTKFIGILFSFGLFYLVVTVILFF